MKVRITSFADAGRFEKERIVLRVDADLDIGRYAVFCTALSEDGSATAGKKTAFWFPDGPVEKDDFVVLYTKKGTSRQKKLENGRTAHFYYWGHEHAMWGGGGNGAVVFRISDWAKSTPDVQGGG